jgi:hypothetical protein
MARKGQDGYLDSELLSFRDIAEVARWTTWYRRAFDFAMIPERGGGQKLVRPWIAAALDMPTRKWICRRID